MPSNDLSNLSFTTIYIKIIQVLNLIIKIIIIILKVFLFLTVILNIINIIIVIEPFKKRSDEDNKYISVTTL